MTQEALGLIETKGLIGTRELGLMKKSARVLNVLSQRRPDWLA